MITEGNWQDALEKVAVKNFQIGFKEKPSERDMLFSVRKSSKLIETRLELGDIGAMGAFDGDLDYEDVSQGWKMTAENTEMAKGMKIRRKFVETDQLDVVTDLPKMLGLAARRRMSVDCFRPLNEGFSSYLTIDGLSVFNGAHVNNDNQGGASQANRFTTAFSEPAVEAMRIAIKRQLSNTEEKVEFTPDLLIVPRELESAAYELIKSSGKVDTANNNKNFHFGRYKLLVSDWLDDPDNFFLVDSEMWKMATEWNNVVNLEFGQAKDFDGFTAKYAAYMFYGTLVKEWRGSAGAEVN